MLAAVMSRRSAERARKPAECVASHAYAESIPGISVAVFLSLRGPMSLSSMSDASSRYMKRWSRASKLPSPR